MKPSDFAFASCPPQQQTATCVAEASAVELEFLPDLLGHTSRGVVPSHHHSFGKQLGADVTRFQAFGEVFGNTAAYLWVEVHDAGFHGWSGTGFLVAPRLLVTAGHVLDPIEGNLILDGNMSGYAAFHDRVGCNQKLLHLVDPQYRNDASHDYGQVATRCHPVFGAPGLAFGRVYLRLWKFCGGKTQRAATVGHFGGKPLQVFSRLVREPDVRCSFWGDSNCVHLADSDDESDGGGSGAPVLDMDGAVRAIYSHSVPAIFDDNDKVGYRLDAAARLSPDIRKVVHDQAPKVARINRHANGPGTDLLIDAVMNRFLQVTTLSVPANAVRLQDPSFVPPETIVSPVAPRGFPEGWSIFYFEERSGHLMHLQTRADGGVRIPDDVIHQDVSVLANLCDIGPTGVIHSWYEIPERYRVEADLVLKRHVLASERVGAETTLVHLVQDGDRRWTKTTIGGARDLGFASAGCTAYDPVDWIGPGTVRADCTAGLAACAAANERDGIVSRGRNVNQYRVHQPHPFVAFVEGRNLCVSEWTPAGGWLRLHTLPVLSGEVRVEAVTMWHGEGAGGEGRLNIAYVTGAPDMPRTLWYVRRDGPANWYRERMIDLHGFTDRVARTLSLTAADSSTGGDVCWQVEGTDGRGRVLMLSLNERDEWNPPFNLVDEGVMPDLGTSGRIRMFRAPDWVGDGTYRQQAFVMQTDGQLGHLWWRNRAWRYQTIHVDQGATEGEATMPAVGMVAPQFLTDGTYGGWHQMNPSPGGSLVYVGTTDSKLWSVLPTRSEDSFCWGSLHSPDSVWLRSVSGASGMPIGWTYEPTTEAYPLTPGVHTGNACFGIWDQTYEECAARVRSANRGPRAKCGQAPEDACAFLQPFPIDIPFGEPSANVPRPTPRADPLARVANAPSPAAAEFVVERGAPNGPDPSRATRPAVQIESGARLRTFHDKIEVIGPQRPPLLAPRRSGQAALKPATTRPSGFMARSVKALLADSDDAAPVLDRAVDFGRKRCTCDRQCGSGNPSGAETHVSGACQMCSRSAGVSPEPLVRGAEAAPARVAARPGLIPAAACRAMIPMPAKSHTTFPILVPIPTLPEQVQIASRRG